MVIPIAKASSIDILLRLRGARAFSREVQASAAQLEAMGLRGATAMGKFAQKSAALKAFGASMTKRVTLPIVAMGGLATKAFMDFDGAMTKSTAIMGDLSTEMREDMSRTAREVGKTTSFSAEDAAESYYFLASAGLDAKQSLAALPAVAKFGQAGMFDMAQATDLLTDAQSALGLKSDDAKKNLEEMVRVSDVLVQANILANGSVEQFSEALTNKAGAALKVLNKDVEEGVAVLAAFADQGLKGRVAGNALSIVLRDLQSASMKNKGAWKEFGVSVYDANGKMRNIGDVIGDLEGKLGGMSDEQKRATLTSLGFQDRSIAFIQTLFGTSDAIKGYEKDLRNAGGATEEVADKQLEGMTEQLKLAGSQLKDLGISLGARLAPAVVWIAKAFGKVGEKLGKMPKPIQTALLVFAGFLAVIGPAVWMVGLFAGGLGKMMILAVRLAPVMKAVVFITRAWTAALLMNPVGLIVIGIIALIAGLVLAYKKVDWFRAAVDAAFAWLKQAAINAAAWVKKAAQWIGNAFQNAKKWITGALNSTMSFIKKHWPLILGILGGPVVAATVLIVKNWDRIKSAAGAVVSYAKDKFNSFVGFFQSIPGKISSAASGMFDGVKAAFKGPLNWIIEKFNWFLGKLRGIEIKLPKVLGVGGGTIGIPGLPDDIPGLAVGGTVIRSGATMVGEQGPELLNLPRAASVVPLNSGVIRETVGGKSGPIHTHVYLNGREIATAFSGEIQNAQARA